MHNSTLPTHDAHSLAAQYRFYSSGPVMMPETEHQRAFIRLKSGLTFNRRFPIVALPISHTLEGGKGILERVTMRINILELDLAAGNQV